MTSRGIDYIGKSIKSQRVLNQERMLAQIYFVSAGKLKQPISMNFKESL